MFWDSSALVALLLLDETRTGEMVAAFDADPKPIIWWGTPVESHAAIVRAVRAKRINREEANVATERVRDARRVAFEIAPSEEVRLRAMRILSAHRLRAGDAMQLAAALTSCEEQTAGETFVCLDRRLRDAARREGFTVLPENL